MRAIWVILAAILAVHLPVLADPPMTNLRIEIRSLGGKPIERASVIVRFVQGRSVVKLGKQIRTTWETRSNQDGVVSIPAIPQGKIRIQIRADGYQTFGEDFQVEEEAKTLVIKLNPPQPQYSVHD